MFSALVYLQFHSIKNRTLGQLKRLKQPKYVVFCLVGALYFYFFFFRRLFQGHSNQGRLEWTPESTAMYEALGALGLMTVLLLAWIVPHQRAALAFTEAEVAFLFPAPISRRGLIHFKLLRSQTSILFTTILLTVITNRFGGNALLRAAGWWVILSTMNLHFLGSSFGRTMLLDRGITNWQRRLGILLAVLTLAAAIAVWAKRTLPVLDLSNLDMQVAGDYVHRVLVSGPMPYLLYPFRLVIRPFLAADAASFLRSVGPALLLLGLHYWWVIRADVAFEEASADASKKLAEKIAAVRSGNWQTPRKAKHKRAPFPLGPTGWPGVALLWKNLISAGQAFTLRMWITLAAIAVGACIGLRHSASGSGLLPALGTAAAFLMIWSLLIGAQFLRQDLRQDLAIADVLKTYPLTGWQLVLGELLAPVVILTGIQWFLLILSIGLFSQTGGGGGVFGWANSLFVGLGLALLFPMLNLITLQIPNAAVLVFPAWFQAGRQGPHGIEATGQRLIFLLGQLLIFIVALIPAAGVFAGVLALLKMITGLAVAMGIAFAGAAVVLALEAALGLMLLGWLFDRFDVSAEMGP